MQECSHRRVQGMQPSQNLGSLFLPFCLPPPPSVIICKVKAFIQADAMRLNWKKVLIVQDPGKQARQAKRLLRIPVCLTGCQMYIAWVLSGWKRPERFFLTGQQTKPSRQRTGCLRRSGRIFTSQRHKAIIQVPPKRTFFPLRLEFWKNVLKKWPK